MVFLINHTVCTAATTRQYESSFKCKHHARCELLTLRVEVEVVEDAESLPYEARPLVDTGLGPLLTFSDIDRKVQCVEKGEVIATKEVGIKRASVARRARRRAEAVLRR